jgi:predicted transcriptional regulator
MATVKMTFSLDEETARRLEHIAERLAMPKSHVVREAIVEYGARGDRLGRAERDRLLAAFDDLVPRIPRRPDEEVEAELRSIRDARRTGGRARAR